METILVTGGAGFVGSCLVRRLVGRQTVRIINLDLLTYAGNRDSFAEVSQDPLHTFVEGNICNAALVEEVLSNYQPCSIVNLAAESHVDRSIGGPKAFVQTNIVGTFTLLEAARSYWEQLPADRKERFRFLQVSTDEVFGSLGTDGAFDESSPYAPSSPYAASKAAADHLVNSFSHTYSLPTLITNCSNNYGPFQFPEKLFPVMILNAIEEKPLPVYGDGLNVRDWLFVEDHALALELVLSQGKPGETYCIGGNNERTNLQVVEAICEACDLLQTDRTSAACRDLLQFVADRPGHDYRYAIDTSKIRQELGWRPVCDFKTGVTRTVRWYAENNDWVSSVTVSGS